MKLKQIAATGLAALLALSMPLSSLAAEKEQTVYVTADETGSVEKVTVSTWLKNDENAQVIEDQSDLQNIQNVKGDETFTQKSDGSITWQAGGEDIYYQGEAQKELPVSMKITYYLDGKEMQPEEMAGKNGHIRIRMDYTNHTSETVMVEGEEEQVCTPFMMLTALILPSETFQNVTITNGELISDGNRQIAVGAAFPGLSDSLQLPEALSNQPIPEYVELEADAEDFELAMSATVAVTGFLDKLGLEEADSLEDIESAIGELQSASSQLVSGSSDLLGGTQELQEGAEALAAGLSAADEGAGQLLSGLSLLNEKKSDLTGGTEQLSAGAQALQTGAANLQSGIKSYTDGAAQLSANLHQLQQIVGGSMAAVSEIPAAVSALVQGSTDLQAGAAQIQAGAAQVQQAAGGLGSQLEQLNYGMSAAQQLIQSAQAYISQQAGEDETLSQISAQLAAVQSQINQPVDTAPLQDMAQGCAALEEGSGQLSAGAADLQAGLQKMQGFSQMAQQLTAAIDALTAGSDALIANNDALNQGAEALSGGAAKLYTGARALTEGAYEVAEGVGQLTAGAGSLKSASKQLSDGASQLAGGASQVADGAAKLCEGMQQFDQEGISKLTSVITDDLKPVLRRAKALAEADRSYGCFDGAKEGMESSVKFIMETAGITKE